MGQDLGGRTDLGVQTRRPIMAMRRGLAATAMFLLSISAAPACDDYPEEMALADARRDAPQPQLPAAQVQTATQAASSTTETAVVEPATPQPQANANSVGASSMTLR